MSDIVLVLGPVAFADFEIPEHIRFGGAQRVAVHKLPGGMRVIDALGPDDTEIAWSGIFGGPDATERALLLDLLRVQGAVLPLTWDVFFYSVVIAGFQAEYRKGWWIPYRLTCTVLRNEAEPGVAATTSVAEQATSDLGAAASLAGGAGIDLSSVQAALATPNATAPGSGAYVQAASAVAGAQSGINGGIAAAEAQMAPLASAVVPFAAGSVATGIAVLNTATVTAAQLGALAAALGYVGRTAINLTNASS